MRTLDYQIPIIDPHQYQGSYEIIPFDPLHPLRDEPLLPLDAFNIAYECYHAKTNGQNPPYHKAIEGSRPDIWLRQSAAEKLALANQHLKSFNAELFVLDGYRPLACQQGLWDFYWQQAKQDHPQGSEQDWHQQASQYIANPNDYINRIHASCPAHASGGAVDITLRDLNSGKLLNMGSRFEAITPISYNDYFERQLTLGKIKPSDQRLYNRRLLHWAMNKAGFVNDPFVYWHYDWGNQLYIKLQRALYQSTLDAAWYGYVELPAHTAHNKKASENLPLALS